LCGLIYVRSWPVTAKASHSAEELYERLVKRGPDYRVGCLERSPVRLIGKLEGSRGFILATQKAEGLELSYLFVEPEAFGSGLAADLYDAALAEPHPRPEFAWVLSSNERSLRFFDRRGWEVDENAPQPDWAAGQYYMKLILPAAN